MFRYKHGLRQERIPIAMTVMSSIGINYGWESHDEHGKPEQLDAWVDAFGAVVRVTDPAVRDGLARPLLLTRNNGTTYGVHTRRAQTLQCVHPQRR
jgi:hypothetical protein